MALTPDRVIVTAALTGVLATREQCPYLPYTPAEIGEEARRAYEAGAAVVHIHGRAPDGGPTWSAETYAEIKREVQARSPIIVNFSTGGFNMGTEGEAEKSERLSYVRKTRPEIAALNMGSMNYAKYSEKRKAFVFDMVFPNPFGDILLAAQAMKEGGVKPELGVLRPRARGQRRAAGGDGRAAAATPVQLHPRGAGRGAALGGDAGRDGPLRRARGHLGDHRHRPEPVAAGGRGPGAGRATSGWASRTISISTPRAPRWRRATARWWRRRSGWPATWVASR
jgi:hypothetical protein